LNKFGKTETGEPKIEPRKERYTVSSTGVLAGADRSTVCRPVSAGRKDALEQGPPALSWSEHSAQPRKETVVETGVQYGKKHPDVRLFLFYADEKIPEGVVILL
jgi:hypothetical protein